MTDLLWPWVLTAMVTWAPPRTDADLGRYKSIASDIEAVAYDPAEEPIVPGPDGRARTALLLASTAYDESFYRADVDDGRARGDGGHSVCVMQVWVEGRTREGWTAGELIADREKCVRTALHILHGSLAWCRGLKDGDRLGGYTHGKCVHPNWIGRGRWIRAFTWPIPDFAKEDDRG
jgi:hypothetical protein